MYEIYVNSDAVGVLTIKDKSNIVILDKSDLRVIKNLTKGWKL